MSLIKKLAGETAIYGVSSILSRVLNFVILTPYLTRVFSTAEYGVFSVMYSYAALLMVLFTYRMETAFFRFGSRDDQLGQSFSTASISILISTVLYVTVMLAGVQWIAGGLNFSNRPDYIILFIFIIAFDALAAIPFAKLRLENRPIRFAVYKILSILVNIAFIFFFLEICPWLVESGVGGVTDFYREEDRIAYVFVSNLIGSGVVMLLLLPEYFKIKINFDPGLWKKMMRYAFPLIIVGIAAVINQLISFPLLRELSPGSTNANEQIVGVFSACMKIAILMNLFIQAFNYAAEPFFFRNAQRADSTTIYAQVGQAFALVGSLVFLGILLYLDIIQHLIGEEFREGLEVVPVLLLAFFCLGLYYNFSIWYKLKDRTIFGMYISVGGAIITLLISVSLIPVYGYYASAWAALACYGFMALASYWTGQKYYPIPYPVAKMGWYILVAIIGYGVSFFIRPFLGEQLWLILFVNTLILGAYIGLMYRLEYRTIRQLL